MCHRPKICVVAPVHAWDDVRVFQKQAVTLAEEGYHVVVLAQAAKMQKCKGVAVKPVRVPRAPRILRFLSLPVVLFQALRERANLYHLHNPDTLPLALVLKSLGKTVVYDTHEDYSERILIREWIPAALRPVLAGAVACLERIAAGFVDASICTQDSVAKRLGNGAMVIGNPPRVDRQLRKEVEALAAGIADRFNGMRAVYIGGIGLARGLLEMVEAIDRANDVVPVRLWLIGPADQKALAVAQSLPGWRYVDYLERQPQENAFAYVARADVGLIALHDVGDFRRTDPNKIYEYLGFGVPFIASDFPAWRAKFSDSDVGWFFPPGDTERLAAVLIDAAQDPVLRQGKGERGQQFVASYNWQKESRRLLALYSRVLSLKRPGEKREI